MFFLIFQVFPLRSSTLKNLKINLLLTSNLIKNFIAYRVIGAMSVPAAAVSVQFALIVLVVNQLDVILTDTWSEALNWKAIKSENIFKANF